MDTTREVEIRPPMQEGTVRKHIGYLIGSSLFFILHAIVGYLQVPETLASPMVDNENWVEPYRVGWMITMLLILAVAPPTLSVLVSMLFKRFRNLSSAAKIIFWTLLVTFCINCLYGFVLLPLVYKNG